MADKTQDIEIEELHMSRERGLEMRVKHPAFASLINILGEWFRDIDPENYAELTFFHADAGVLVLTVRRQEGKPPGQIVDELRARIAELEAALAVATARLADIELCTCGRWSDPECRVHGKREARWSGERCQEATQRTKSKKKMKTSCTTDDIISKVG